MMRRITVLAVSLAALALVASSAFAVPNLLQYQGRLTDASGNPSNGSFSIVYSIYPVATGGVAIFSETRATTVTNGLFNVLLGGTTPLPAFGDANLFLGIKVGADAEMTPRQQIASVPFALRSTFASAIPWIIVNFDGTILRQSGGFTVVRNGAGDYTVNNAVVDESTVGFIGTSFNRPGGGTSPVVVTCFANGAAGYRVIVFDLTGAQVDHDFSLVAPVASGLVTAPPEAPPTSAVAKAGPNNEPIK